MSTREDTKFLKEQIITYLGNKRSLLPYIEKEIKIIQKQMKMKKTVNVDLFSGSGVVARMMKKYSSKLIVNDLETYSQIINECYLTNITDFKNVEKEYLYYYDLISKKIEDGKFVNDGIIRSNYSPSDTNNIKLGERVFYTAENALIIDTIRDEIDRVPEHLKKYLLAPLLQEASVKTNTAGIFKGFYKDSSTGIGKFGGNGEYALQRIKNEIKLNMPIFSNFECEVKVCREDSNKLVQDLKNLDIVYIDPPYNQHPYGSNYFMLNLIADNEIKSELSKVSGIPKDWQRSEYNVKARALKSMDGLISNIDSKYLIISYNSEGFITLEEMSNLLSKYESVEIKEIVYNTYRGSRNLAERNLHVTEYLFIVRKGK